MLFCYLFIAWVICKATCAPSQRTSANRLPVPPSEDPIYSPPTGFETAELGTILKIRQKENPYGVMTFKADVKAVYQILVRSEDTFKQPIVVMSTIFVPHNANYSRLLSYQVAEDAALIDCSPSYAMQLYSNPRTYISAQIEFMLVAAALNDGWIVTVPDHEGPKSTCVVGWLAGYAVLNSIKAALQSGNQTGIDPAAEVAMWGYSGGSLATGWAAQLQPTYLPSLNLVGAAFGGVLVDILSVFKHCMGGIGSGLVVSGLNALSNEYPVIKTLLRARVYPEKYAEFTLAKNFCEVENLLYYMGVGWNEYFSEGVEILQNPIVLNVTRQNNMLLNGMTPECPVFLYMSENDELVPFNDTVSLYHHFCEHGVSVTMRTDILSEHVVAAVSGASLALKFLKDRFEGIPLSRNCSSEASISNIFSPGAMDGFCEIGSSILEIFGNFTAKN